MPLYYFHVADGETILDEVGVDLPDVASVRAEAVRLSSELLNIGHGAQLWGDKPWRVWVTDQPKGAGRTVATIEVAAVWLG